MTTPSILTFTVMKNEGPFILEWVAWQRLIGVTSIVVLTNDCDDGTEELLDRLDERGIVMHLPNPVSILSDRGKLRPHKAGFEYGKRTPQWRRADYVLMCDCDEFPVIKTGNGTLGALLSATGYPDVISMNERMFGTGQQVSYSEAPVTETFLASCPGVPDAKASRRGFKSICRNDPARINIRNHRPLPVDGDGSDLVWLDGSGEPLPQSLRPVHHKGHDVRGRTALAQINHYALRSLESFLVKIDRGGAMTLRDRFDASYFRRRNRTEERNPVIGPMLPRLRAEIAALRRDAETDRLHRACVAAHRAKIAHLRRQPAIQEFLDRIGFGRAATEALPLAA